MTNISIYKDVIIVDTCLLTTKGSDIQDTSLLHRVTSPLCVKAEDGSTDEILAWYPLVWYREDINRVKGLITLINDLSIDVAQKVIISGGNIFGKELSIGVVMLGAEYIHRMVVDRGVPEYKRYEYPTEELRLRFGWVFTNPTVGYSAIYQILDGYDSNPRGRGYVVQWHYERRRNEESGAVTAIAAEMTQVFDFTDAKRNNLLYSRGPNAYIEPTYATRRYLGRRMKAGGYTK